MMTRPLTATLMLGACLIGASLAAPPASQAAPPGVQKQDLYKVHDRSGYRPRKGRAGEDVSHYRGYDRGRYPVKHHGKHRGHHKWSSKHHHHHEWRPWRPHRHFYPQTGLGAYYQGGDDDRWGFVIRYQDHN